MMKRFLEAPKEIRQQIWKELGRATQDRHHAWRTPVLATNDQEGRVNARTVVLRKVNADDNEGGGTLDIYTDSRSPKVSELADRSSVCLVFWSTRLNWQLRVRAEMSIQTDGPYVESLWQSVRQTRAAGDYLGILPPGVALPSEEDSADSATASEDTTKGYFAVLSARVTEIDWLELAREKHRRARMVGNSWEWLKP